MSFGKMNEFIELLRTGTRTDEEGFGVTEEEVLASVRAYREPRNASQRWSTGRHSPMQPTSSASA